MCFHASARCTQTSVSPEDLEVKLVTTFQALVLADHVLIDHFAKFSSRPSSSGSAENGSQDSAKGTACGRHENRYCCSAGVGADDRTERSTNRGTGTAEPIDDDDTTRVTARTSQADRVSRR